jgi:hypothetical protein
MLGATIVALANANTNKRNLNKRTIFFIILAGFNARDEGECPAHQSVENKVHIYHAHCRASQAARLQLLLILHHFQTIR